MNDTKGKKTIIFIVVFIIIFILGYILATIIERRAETATINRVDTGIASMETHNDKFAKAYPNEYQSWKSTMKSTKLTDDLAERPAMVILWAGYGFAKDYNGPRGHYYAIVDNMANLRTGAPVDKKTGPMPTACWTCKSPDVPRLMNKVGEVEFFRGKWARWGGEIVNPIGCTDCHDAKTMELKITRPTLLHGLKALHMKTKNLPIQEMRSLVCAQCHEEYYFKKEKGAGILTFPWGEGTTAAQMEKYYDKTKFADWVNPISKTPMLKAQHPGWSLYRTGVHAKNNVSCADCHMPYVTQGSMKYTDHRIQNPLDNMERTCFVCHRTDKKTIKGIVKDQTKRYNDLRTVVETNLVALHYEIQAAMKAGATDKELQGARMDVRHAQWRWDYSVASHGAFFHAPGEVLKTLADALNIAKNGRLKIHAVLAKHGIYKVEIPDYSTKAKAQKLVGLDYKKLKAAKAHFLKTLGKQWIEGAKKKGLIGDDVYNTLYKDGQNY